MTDVLQTGQQIWVRQVGDAWWLAQVPEVNSALVSIICKTVPLWRWSVALISIRASLTAPPGALRQVGSNIKPFLIGGPAGIKV